MPMGGQDRVRTDKDDSHETNRRFAAPQHRQARAMAMIYDTYVTARRQLG